MLNTAKILRDLLLNRINKHCFATQVDDATIADVIKLAESTKTEGLIYKCLQEVPVSLPSIKTMASASAQVLLRTNLHHLAWTIKIVNLLELMGLSPIAFKGCLRSQEIYGSWDARRSSDIDILVRPAEYRRACAALAEAGFAPLVSPDSRWWHEHLGESPFVRMDGSGIIVDLHNSLQQPGGPYPVDLEHFFVNRTKRSFGRETVQILTPEHSLLVCAISYGKAVRESQPWLSQAHELAVALDGMPEDRQMALSRLAAQQGLANIYREAVAAAMELFGPRTIDMPFSDAQSELLLSAVGIRDRGFMSRTRELWRWCDGSGLGRINNFGVSVMRVVRRDACQFREDINGRRALQW